ncbi:hypothetical protein [Dysgonomonas sp. Marseille-P4361]|uniref:hypothetical protein n=1 Tax=Dysgonomonas sp. Marseille-P4361 TaxID=2161820 RepID=UPI000D54D57C|nr:hypothetical protein [Dysgonomonas sp. Marseille-P4361]
MRGSVIINGVDIADFGAFILRGGDHDILTMPARTEPKKNNWFEYDGLDVDLSEVFFNARSLLIQFYLSADNSFEYELNLSLFSSLITSGYINLYSREFNRTFKYRYLSATEYNHKGGLYKPGDKRGAFTVSFSMDDPIQLFKDPTILAPNSTYKHATHILLNGIDLGEFGIIVNEAYSSMLKLPVVKAPLTRSFARRSGLWAYPNSNPRFEAKEIALKCTMRADSREEFYHNYEALFNNLSKTKSLQIESYIGEAECYYSKMEDFKKMGVFSRGILVSFTLKLIQIDAGLTVFVLGAEDGSALLTEAGEYIEITR